MTMILESNRYKYSQHFWTVFHWNSDRFAQTGLL